MHEIISRKLFNFFLWSALISMCVLCAPISALAQDTCSEGIISQWKFDEINGNVAEDSIGPNHGDIDGATRIPGKDGVGGALDFVHFNHVAIPNPIGFSSLDAITVEAWINLGNTTQTHVIVMKGDVTNEPFFLRTQGTQLFGYLRTGVDPNNTHPVWVLGGNLTAGIWHHVAMTYDSTFLKIFVDGVEVGQIAQSGPVFTDDETLYMGLARSLFQISFGYTGDMDEVAIHERALTGAEIEGHYMAGSSGCPAPGVTANAGLDQTVNEGGSVLLDGVGSGPDPNSLNFAWTQVAGPIATVSGANTSTPNFTAPYVSSNQTLTFELIVDDGANFSDPDTVDIVVVDVNSPPVADAGDNATIKEGGIVVLDGSNSFDPEADPITQYTWTKVGGPAVSLDLTNPVMPTFVASGVIGAEYVFKLEVSDGKESSVPSVGADSSFDDTVKVTVVVNSAPTANAGLDAVVDEAGNVPLAGSGNDPDGDAVTYQWSQVSGPSVTISNPSSPNASFTAPYVSPGGADLEFELRVDDNDSINPLFGTDRVFIHVSNINDPPTCSLAQPSQDSLWPPNHKMKQITIEGVMDADSAYNTVTLNITGVTQDEPVNGLGDGDSSPDAVIQNDAVADTVLIRAERSGTSNGRVYQINFTASDGAESCQGAVQVSVPHSRKSGSVDDGQLFDSTQP